MVCSAWKNRAEIRGGVLPLGRAAQLPCLLSFNFHLQKSTWLKFYQRKASPCSAGLVVATLCPALWEETPFQHGVWVEEAEGRSASPGFPGTQQLGKAALPAWLSTPGAAGECICKH